VELGDLNLPVKVSDAINAALAAIGIVLPLAVTQGFVLILCVVALAYGIIKLRRREGTALLSVLIVAGFGLFAAGVGISWIDHGLHPLSGEVKGQVEVLGRSGPNRYSGLRAALLDFHGENIARETGIVDSTTGYFVLTFSPVFGDRPRLIRVIAPGCASQDFPLGQTRLREGSSFLLQYLCKDQR